MEEKQFKYEWSPEAEVKISGLQFQALNDMFNVLTSDSSSDYTKNVYIYETSKVLTVIFNRLVEEDIIKKVEVEDAN